jgi:hypothetical protein
MSLLWIDTKCSHCSTAARSACEFKNYGEEHIDNYELGDRIALSLPRDRILRYIPTGGPGLCANCQHRRVPDPRIIIVRNDILESTYTFPDENDVGAEYGIFLGSISSWEKMNLVKQYGVMKIDSICRQAAREVFPNDWKRQWEEHSAAFMKRLRGLQSPNAKPESLADLPPLNFRLDKDRDRILDRLSEMHSNSFIDSVNYLHHELECPSCEIKSKLRIPFPYGSCSERVYSLGQKIDWTGPGHIREIRDPDLRYVPLQAKACASCGFEAAGMTTIREEVITDIYFWPKKLYALIQNPPEGLKKNSQLTDYLIVREFGEHVYELALEERNRSQSKDYLTTQRFYQLLKSIYLNATGREYAG